MTLLSALSSNVSMYLWMDGWIQHTNAPILLTDSLKTTRNAIRRTNESQKELSLQLVLGGSIRLLSSFLPLLKFRFLVYSIRRTIGNRK